MDVNGHYEAPKVLPSAEPIKPAPAQEVKESPAEIAAREARLAKWMQEYYEAERIKAAERAKIPAKVHKHFNSPLDLQTWIRSFNGQRNYIPTRRFERVPEKDRYGKIKTDASGQPIWEKDSYGQYVMVPVRDAKGNQVRGQAWGFRNDWEATSQGVEMLGTGDMNGIAEAQEFVRRFNESIERQTRTWQPSMAGAFPNVPAYLAGEPEHMWRLQDDLSDKTPMRIWVGVTTALNVPDEMIRQRGIVLAALVLAIAERRPVMLTPYSVTTDDDGRVCMISWDLQGSPFVFSQLANLTNSKITRYATIYATSLANPNLTDWGMHLGQEEGKKLLGFKKGDLMVPSGANSWRTYLDDPFAWISKRVHEAWGEEDLE